MEVKKLYHATSRQDALRKLSRNIEWALKPVQVREENGDWYVIELIPSRFANQTLYLMICSMLQFLNAPDHFPGYYQRLTKLLPTDPSLKGFAYDVAREFDEKYPDLHGQEYHDAIDRFIEKKIKALPR